MKSIIFLTSMLLFSNAYAECVLRTTAVTKVDGQIGGIADIRPMVTNSSSTHRKCSVNFRVKYQNVWQTVMEGYEGLKSMPDSELCYQAVELGVRRFLASKEGKTMHNEEQMYCSDEPDILVRPVQKGEIIRESEVTPHPTKVGYFEYKGTTCRWFIEASVDVKVGDIRQWQGIMCQVGKPTDYRWAVVDKF